MSRVFKRAFHDPKTGTKRKSSKYYGHYSDADGIRRRVVLCADKAASEAMLHDMRTKAEREKAGLAGPFDEQRKRPLRDHLADFAKTLRDNDNSPAHCQTTESRVRAVLDACRFLFLNDIQASRVQGFLADLRKSGTSQQTMNHYLRAVKQFSRWMVRDHRTKEDRLAYLSAGNVKTDRRIERREFTDDELGRLLEAAKNGPVRSKLTGGQRFALYATALGTGLRASELASLTPGDFDFEVSPATVHVKAENEKARRGDTLPMPPGLVELLRPWLSMLPNRQLIWPGKWAAQKRASKFIQFDEGRAGIEYRNEDGQADFHALRHTYLSRLGRSGAPAKVMQRLARHSTVELTIGRYTHANLLDLGAAVDRLPELPTGCNALTANIGTIQVQTVASIPARPKRGSSIKEAGINSNGARVVRIEKSGAKSGPVDSPDRLRNLPNSNQTHALRAVGSQQCTGLENQCTARYRGFKSLPLRFRERTRDESS